MPLARTLKLLLVCLLAASWLCAGNAAWAKVGERIPRVKDAAPGINPKNAVHRYGDPCPDNITVDTWEQSSTRWREIYEACKPEGAPTRHATNWEDLEHFLRASGPPGGDKREHKMLVDQWSVKRCAISIIYDHDPIDAVDADFITESVVESLVLYFKTNGRDPAGERMVLIARAYNKGGETEKMFGYFDYSAQGGKIRFLELRNGRAVPVKVE